MKELFLDYLKGEILFANKEALLETIEERKAEYENNSVAVCFAQDYYENMTIHFAYPINKIVPFFRFTVQKDVEQYLAKYGV